MSNENITKHKYYSFFLSLSCSNNFLLNVTSSPMTTNTEIRVLSILTRPALGRALGSGLLTKLIQLITCPVFTRNQGLNSYLFLLTRHKLLSLGGWLVCIQIIIRFQSQKNKKTEFDFPNWSCEHGTWDHGTWDLLEFVSIPTGCPSNIDEGFRIGSLRYYYSRAQDNGYM